jgi:hypothetical protein
MVLVLSHGGDEKVVFGVGGFLIGTTVVFIGGKILIPANGAATASGRVTEEFVVQSFQPIILAVQT